MTQIIFGSPEASAIAKADKKLSAGFIVGLLEHPSKDDATFDDDEKAESYAYGKSVDDHVYAVWVNDGSGEIVSIIYQQQVFRP